MDDVGKLKVLLGAVVLTFALAYFLGGVSLEFPYWLGTTTTTTTSTTSTTTSTSTTTTTLVEIKTFTDNGGAVETKNGKPVVRMYSTTWCPHCRWVKDAYETTVKEYVDKGEVIAYHWELDIDDDTLRPEKIPVPQSEKNLFKKFNPRGGGVPTFIFGSKYYRIGNGYEREKNLEAEKAEFRAVIEALLAETRQLSANKSAEPSA